MTAIPMGKGGPAGGERETESFEEGGIVRIKRGFAKLEAGGA